MPKQPAKQCQHERTVLDVSGSISFYAGDVNDDIHSEVICLDCGAVLSPDQNEIWEEMFDLA